MLSGFVLPVPIASTRDGHVTTSLLSSRSIHLTAFSTCLVSISPLRLSTKNGLPLFNKQQPAYCKFRKSSELLPSLSPSSHTRSAILFAGQQRRCGHKEQTFGHVRKGEGGMIWESSVEKRTLPYVKQRPVGICCMTQGARSRCSVTAKTGGKGWEVGRRFRGRGHVCTYGWLMLM